VRNLVTFKSLVSWKHVVCRKHAWVKFTNVAFVDTKSRPGRFILRKKLILRLNSLKVSIVECIILLETLRGFNFFTFYFLKMSLGIYLVMALALATLTNADDSIELGDSDFDSTLENYETALVMFYAPW